MPSQTLSTVESILKTRYIPGIQTQFNASSVLLTRLKRRKPVVVSGSGYVYGLAAGPNEAIGARADTQVLPEPAFQRYAQAVLRRKHIYGGWSITGAAIDAAARDGAMVDIIDEEMRGLERDMSAAMNRQLYGDGSGELARVAGISGTGTSSTITAATNVANVPSGRCGVQYLRPGMRVSILVTSTGDPGSGVESAVIQSVTASTNTFVIAPGCTSTANPGNHSVYAHGARNLEVMGLGGIAHVDDPQSGPYGGLGRSANAFWRGNFLHNGGTLRKLTIDLMQQAVDVTEITGGGKVSLILCDPTLWRIYAWIMYRGRAWMNYVKVLDGGWESLAFGSIPVVKDRHCQPCRMYFIDESVFDLLVERDLSPMDEDGNVLVRQGSGSTALDAYEMRLVWRGELGCKQPNAATALVDLNNNIADYYAAYP